MEDTLKTIAALVAAAGSVLAVAKGLDELTSGARLRNLEATLRAAQTIAEEAADPVIASVHRATLAKIIARNAVSLRLFLRPLVWLVVGPAIVVLSARQDFGALGLVTSVSLVTVLLGAFTVPEILYLARERAIVSRCFWQGEEPVKAFTRTEPLYQLVPLRLRAWAMGFALGLGLTARGLGEIFFSAEDARPAWLFLIGSVLVWQMWSPLRDYATNLGTDELTKRQRNLQPTWIHPMPDGTARPSPNAPPAESKSY